MTTPSGDAAATARIASSDERIVRRSSAQVAQFAPGTVIAERYRIAGMLGSGGMGEVYRADDTKLDQPVALKFLPARLARDPMLLGRLHDEVRLGRQVSHPNVCRLYDIVDWEGAHFVAMEYVDGEDLAKLLRRIGRLAHDKAVDIARGIASGLHAAHAKGILHRDLKPANIMIDSRGDPRIMDFGLALSDDEDDGTISGTPAYMAPEQLQGAPATVQSDLYAIGLVMYELFTGKAAHAARTLRERVRDAASEVTTPSSIVRDLDPAVERIILRCLSDDPAQRPRSARQVIEALPGGDPLAAAMAAGETPSPRIVAAGGTEGSLRPAVAWAMLGAIGAMLALILFQVRDGRALQSWGLGTPPEVQQIRATELLRRFGLPEQPFRNGGFEEKFQYHAWVYVNDRSPQKWERFRRGLPRVTYWLREESAPLIDFRPRSPYLRPQRTYPHQTAPDSSAIEIDLRGRLYSLKSVPSGSWKPRPLDWNALLGAAGLSDATFVKAEPRIIPPMFADARAAWTGKHPDDGTPIRVEAAAWRGVPVFFQISAPWDEKDVSAQMPFGGSRFSRFLTLLSLAAIVFGIVLAWRNLRLRRGDRQAAVRIGAAMFLLDLVALMIMTEHEPVFDHELSVLFASLARALFTAAMFAILYVAVEPFVRRRWPDRLIAWARLVAGKWRDPMVGRDVLIGIIAGLLNGTVAANRPRLVALMTGDPAAPYSGAIRLADIPAGGAAHFLSSVSDGIVTALILMTVLVVLTIVLRRRWLAIAAFYAVIFLGLRSASADLWPIPFFAASAGLFTLIVARFGMLSMAAMQTTFMAVFFAALPDAFAWYTARGLTTVVLLFACAVWAFFTSLGGQRAFAAGILDE
ncbi:MAG: eukaryotic-like serine/threonine-protein kinase [Acidobacteriota bacterium]|nr:eukaryotic-like serine/threonine-protein kinase [Acidobacteriota bacterium]